MQLLSLSEEEERGGRGLRFEKKKKRQEGVFFSCFRFFRGDHSTLLLLFESFIESFVRRYSFLL